ncbi:FxDxF family PEP-CTERM protein [Sphingomonas rhizophila]|uniref:FxDxF family PEP-CTERM protein n=1 Tax=Sphingomonas rhizophila TaxID=2071607 RepID=UPI001FEA0A05|nr:FxDxF family PEP-CTERM protein [Sphingomonas rhizophila]
MGEDGTGSGSVTTSIDINALFEGATDTDFISVLVNGFAATASYRLQDGVTPCNTPGVGGCGSVETYALTNVPIYAFQLNTIEINGISRGLGSYGGQASFTPGAVPEPGTWAMMLLGFGAIGFGLRRRRPAFQAQLA